ncbi:ceramidase domain-containing protein [Postechiella marina]|uniref:Ceramidase domain-containing protein n=1 Tax=Postechiella marina TaxID=943941 RepID=A0ABP8C9V4_9FLAO
MNLLRDIKNDKTGFGVLIALGVVAIVIILLTPSIPQNQSYHQFSDTAVLFGIPNFWNVFSNLPFAIVGILGLVNIKVISQNKGVYRVFFYGVIFVSIGSGYYHIHPKDTTLIWDRLPMTIVFMSFVTIIITEFISVKIGRLILIPLLLLGVTSVLYWVAYGELKPYVFIQFYPMLAIPVVLLFFKSNYNKVYAYWLLLLAYVMAKFLECFDYQMFEYLKIISGHSLKHLIAAIGLFVLLYSYTKRENINKKTS